MLETPIICLVIGQSAAKTYYANMFVYCTKYDIIILVKIMTKRKTHNEFLNEVKQKYGNKIKILTEYQNNLTKILIKLDGFGSSM